MRHTVASTSTWLTQWPGCDTLRHLWSKSTTRCEYLPCSSADCCTLERRALQRTAIIVMHDAMRPVVYLSCCASQVMVSPHLHDSLISLCADARRTAGIACGFTVRRSRHQQPTPKHITAKGPNHTDLKPCAIFGFSCRYRCIT